MEQEPGTAIKKDRNLPYASQNGVPSSSNQTLTLGGQDSHQTFAMVGGPGSKSYQSLESSLASKENQNEQY